MNEKTAPAQKPVRTLTLGDCRRAAGGLAVTTNLRSGAAQTQATLNLQKASDNMQE